MVYNNIPGDDSLQTSWGFALWIEDGEGAVLFDTGGDGDVLINNITAAGLDFTRLHTIVISHEHWDHINGLPVIINKLKRQIAVFVPADIESKIRELIPGSDIIPVSAPQCITGEIWSTGPIAGTHKGKNLSEQALMINKQGNSYLVTGCAHPGINNFVSMANKHFPENNISIDRRRLSYGRIKR